MARKDFMNKEELIALVLEAHGTLGRESDLSPDNPVINGVLSRLVQGVMEGCAPGDVDEVLREPRVRAVRGRLLERLAVAEGALEAHWGEILCGRASLTADNFSDFIYWGCYRQLVQDEVRCWPRGLALGEGQSIAFVGAGPLPLSAILLHTGTGARVTCIDVAPEACRLASRLCRKAGLTGIDIACACGAEFDYTGHPAVLVASLVRDKRTVAQRIWERCPHAIVALRSAEGLSTLLYDPVDETELEATGCRLLARTPHNPRVINTTLFCGSAQPCRSGRCAAEGAAARAARSCSPPQDRMSSVTPAEATAPATVDGGPSRRSTYPKFPSAA
jgi:hypothetical protein